MARACYLESRKHLGVSIGTAFGTPESASLLQGRFAQACLPLLALKRYLNHDVGTVRLVIN
ncbi:MAG: hypothetical protein AAF035_04145 [Pseudomonadota bacterium]